jgi:hypothetical protein
VSFTDTVFVFSSFRIESISFPLHFSGLILLKICWVNTKGFSTAVAVEQRSPAGNIYEKGGIVAGNGTRKNNSLNPFAPYQFKLKLQSFYFITKGRGRALIRAGREDAGKANSMISRAQFAAELSLQNKFNREAAKNG